jgi:hypothetical protein
MARGRLRCLGTALRLKARFGSGYRISIRVRGSGGVDGTGTAAGLQQGTAWKPLAAPLSPAASPRVDLRADGRSQASQGEISAPTASVASDVQPYAPGQAPDTPHRRDSEATRQMEGIRDLFMQRLGIKSGEATWAVCVFACGGVCLCGGRHGAGADRGSTEGGCGGALLLSLAPGGHVRTLGGLCRACPLHVMLRLLPKSRRPLATVEELLLDCLRSA